jgi:hypothetical protein
MTTGDGGRYSRNEALFGAEGQAKVAATVVAIVGLGGLGSHVAQQLAYLGVGAFALIDDDTVTESSLNRLIGSEDSDVSDETHKVAAAARMIKRINPSADVREIVAKINTLEAEQAVATADFVFGCLDRDLARLQSIKVCARSARIMIDLASDTGGEEGDEWYGGHVILCDGTRCLSCLGLLDQEDMARDLMSSDQRAAHDRIYGVPTSDLGGTGPMVVSINGVVASVGVTEFMAHVTGLRAVYPYLIYRADQQMIRKNTDSPSAGCYYCQGLWRAPAGAITTDP